MWQVERNATNDLLGDTRANSATSVTYAKHVNMQQHNDACY